MLSKTLFYHANASKTFYMPLKVFFYFSGSDLESTELQHSDGFALLAVHLLLDINKEKGM